MTFTNGKAHEQNVVDNGNYVIVNSKFISSDGKVRKYSDSLICELHKNDIVMVMSDVPNGRAMSKCFLIDADGTYTLNQRICALSGTSTPLFYLSQINRNKYYLKFDDGVSQTNLKKDEVLNCPIFNTSKDERKKISSFIELINQRITCQEQMLGLLKKYKRGVINRLINELSLTGTLHNFAELVTIQRGGSPRPIDDYITDDIEGINWIKIGDVSADTLYIIKTKERIKPSGAKKSRKVYPGDLILSNSMSFGRPYIMKIDGCIHDGWLLIRDENGIFDKKFLCYYLASDIVLSQYRRFAAGSCVSNLNSDLVGDLQVVLPSMEQQKKSAAIFEQIDSYVVNASKQYECLCQLKQGLLQQLFI